MDDRDISGRNAAHLNAIFTASSRVASPVPEQSSSPPAGRRATSGALAPLSELRAQRAVRSPSPSSSSGDHRPKAASGVDGASSPTKAPSIDELTALGQAIASRSMHRPPAHGGETSAARRDGVLGAPGKRIANPDIQSDMVVPTHKRQRTGAEALYKYSPGPSSGSTSRIGPTTSARPFVSAGPSTHDERHDVFDIRRTPSDELFRLGESIRLRTAGASSAAVAASQSRHSPTHGYSPTGPHTYAQPHVQESRPDGRQSAPDAGHLSPASGSADFYFTHAGPLTESDRLPYRLLDTLHQDLLSNREIQQVASRRGLPIGKVMDVDLNEFEAINAAAGEYASIGTKALSTCIAVCARGLNARGESILGLHHYDGRNSAEGALAELDARMKNQGSVRNQFYLVGGMVLPADSGLGSYPAEADLLAMRDRYNIRGARLHVLEGEYDAHGNENMLNVVVTPNHIFFSKRDLYKSD